MELRFNSRLQEYSSMGVRLEFSRIPGKLDKICKSDKVGLYMAQQAEIGRAHV